MTHDDSGTIQRRETAGYRVSELTNEFGQFELSVVESPGDRRPVPADQLQADRPLDLEGWR